MLHVAPEAALERLFGSIERLDYVTGDFDPALAPLHLDLRALQFPDESFDWILCSHVLNYIDRDDLAMREIARVLRPGGRAVLLVPVDQRRERTDEARVEVPQRYKRPGEADPVRVYGRDFAARLEVAGLSVEEVRPRDNVSAREAERYGLDHEDVLFVCRRAGA